MATLSASGTFAQQEVHPVPDVYGSISKNDVLGTSEAGFIVGGEYARVMFDLMKSAPVNDPCGEGLLKQDNAGFQCHRNPDGFTQCSFGYDFDLQVMTAGPLTC